MLEGGTTTEVVPVFVAGGVDVTEPFPVPFATLDPVPALVEFAAPVPAPVSLALVCRTLDADDVPVFSPPVSVDEALETVFGGGVKIELIDDSVPVPDWVP